MELPAKLYFRPARRVDLEKIVELLANDPLGSQREDYRQPLPEAYLRAFDSIEQDPGQELMVVESRGQIIGSFQLSFLQYLTYRGGVRAQLEAVRVHADYRQQGIGRKIVEWAALRAQERGAHLLQLTTDKQRPEALEFYQKMGFTASHEGLKLHFK